MKNRSIIRNLVLTEISHVENPANPGARVVLWKSSANSEGVESMSPEELQKKASELETKTSALEKRLEIIVSKAKDAGVDIAIDGDSVSVTKAAEPEMIEFEGQMIAKASIPAPVLASIAKHRQETDELRKRLDQEAIEKRASAELPNLRGTNVEKAALLRAVDGIADEAVRKSVIESLKAADAAVRKQFEEQGSNHVDETSPSYQLDALAKKYAAEHGVSYHVGFAEVTKSGEGKRLAAEAMTKQN